jgi:hypothetical protein
MAILLDSILPSIIVGFLIMIIANINMRLMNAQIENRVSSEMQMFSNTAMDVIQEEVRSLIEIEQIVNPHKLRFENADNEIVEIYRHNRYLVVKKTRNGNTDSTSHFVRLSSLEFQLLSQNDLSFLESRVQTNALESEYISESNYQIAAVTKRNFFLRNLD